MNSSLDVALAPAMLKIIEVLSTEKEYAGFKEEIGKLQLFDIA